MKEAPQSMQEVLDMIAASRQAYQAQWQGLSEDDMTARPGPQTDWSVKDQIAHLTWWETYMMGVLTLLRAGQSVPRIKDYDALNARVFAQQADMPLDFVIESFERNWVVLLTFLNSLTIADLMADDGRGWGWIQADTFGHYDEHLPDLTRYIESLKA